MITLEYIEPLQNESVETINEDRERVLVTAKEQEKNGFGNPKSALNFYLEKYAAPTLAQHFKEVKAPSQVDVPRFCGDPRWTYQEQAESVDTTRKFSLPPRIVMVELRNGLSEVRASYEKDGSTQNIVSALPLIPLSAQEKMKFAKDLLPSIKFHILFLPNWKPAPNNDPVVLGEAAGRFFEICRWNSDDDLFVINEYLV